MFVAYYLLLTAYWGQVRVHSLFLFSCMTSDLSADGASGFGLSNLTCEGSGFTQGHQLVLASSSLRGWEVREIFHEYYSTVVLLMLSAIG